jgi:glycosyltransferase involved in cell wall biosynthesis
MKYKNSGLYDYCLNLGNYVKKILDRDECEKMLYYVPASVKAVFSSKEDCIIEKNWHKKYFRPFLWNCDIWHAPFQAGRIVPRYHSKMKIVLTIHDMNVLYEEKTDKERTESLQRTQQLIDASDAVICISEHCKKDVINHLNTDGKTVHVIHNGIDDLNKVPGSPVGYKPSRPFVFTCGSVNRKKNFHTLISLLNHPDLELIIAGRLDESDYVEQIRLKATEMGVSDRLNILGPITDHDKAWYYRHSCAFARPWSVEEFDASIVEAMSYGKPVFLSDQPSVPEISGDAAFYFSGFEADHMLQVFRDGMRSYIKNNLAPLIMKRAQEFNWEKKASEYVHVYRTLY